MKNSLSLAAQAVLDAFLASNWESTKDRQRLAAALRAAADQVVPVENMEEKMFAWQKERLAQRLMTHDKLLAIADELEGAQ